MKNVFLSVLAAAVLMAFSSCKKYVSPWPPYPTPERKIRFQLYTDKDFSGNTSTINFSVFIRQANTTLFDSSLSSMQIKDIPDANHKIVIERAVTGNDNMDLAAGFHYEIQNVGNSSYIDTSKAGNLLKVIDFDFQ